MAQMTLGLEHIHNDKNITHRDFKPANILVFPGNILKIGDFGIAKEHDENSVFVSTRSDRKYAAPEILNMDYGQKFAF